MKIRLHGTLSEVERAAEKIRSIFRVVSVSDPYKDRGGSKWVRVYIEVKEES